MVNLAVAFVADQLFLANSYLGTVGVFAALLVAHDELADNSPWYLGGRAAKNACGKLGPLFVLGLVLAIGLADLILLFLGHF